MGTSTTPTTPTTPVTPPPPPIPIIFISASADFVLIPNTVMFTAMASNATSFQWQHSTNGITFENISGAVNLGWSENYDAAGVHFYRCVATGAGGVTVSDFLAVTALDDKLDWSARGVIDNKTGAGILWA